MTFLRCSIACVLVVVLATACHTRERMCPSGQYPVRSIEYPTTGRTCVPDSQAPPRGYERFPRGHVPTYVDQDR